MWHNNNARLLEKTGQDETAPLHFFPGLQSVTNNIAQRFLNVEALTSIFTPH